MKLIIASRIVSAAVVLASMTVALSTMRIMYSYIRDLQGIVSIKELSLNESSFEGLIPRSFESWKYNSSALCERGFDSLPGNGKQVLHEGLLFVKPSKAASSTAAGINLRMARNMARRLNRTFTFCQASYWHGNARDYFTQRSPTNSFLWSIVREPTRRIQSRFFHFKVSREKMEPTDRNYQRHAVGQANSYLGLLPLVDFRLANETKTTIMQSILDDYNFVGTTERFDESLVVLQLLLDLPVSDILYLSAKPSGGFDDGKSKNGCTYIVPKFLTPGMDAFFNSAEWADTIRYERAFYLAVNRSLDLTIEKIGQSIFRDRLLSFRRVRESAFRQCSGTVFPCLESGELSAKEDRDCLVNDSGCGTGCLDSVSVDV